MRSMVLAALTALSLVTNASAEIKPIPGFDYVEALFPGCTPHKCAVSKDNFGGYFMPFETAMNQMLERGIRSIEIDALCASMCASIMDRIREQGVSVCMTLRGVFGFHKSTMFKTDENDEPVLDKRGDRIFDRYEDPNQTSPVRDWIRMNGGAPVSIVLFMDAPEAIAHNLFQLCPSPASAILSK